MAADGELQVELRPATEEDLELMMAWRNNPMLYENFYRQNGPLTWSEHLSWWTSRENRRDWIIKTYGEDRGRDVGCVNFSQLEKSYPEIGIWIGEVTLWGKGVASQAVEVAIEWLREQDEYEGIRARVLTENTASRRFFEKLGFEHVGGARAEEEEYRYSL